MADFDKDYWEQRWHANHGEAPGSMERNPPNPYLMSGVADLTPGTALDAGCGAGAEAIWLAAEGWQVTAADISADALAKAARRADANGVTERIQWVEADLTTWQPATSFDLVTTHYAHPTMPQLAFYERIAAWVEPAGTLLIVGHLHTHDSGSHEDHGHPPAEASATVEGITAALDDATWEVVTAEQHVRTVAGRAVPVQDVVVQAVRRSR